MFRLMMTDQPLSLSGAANMMPALAVEELVGKVILTMYVWSPRWSGLASSRPAGELGSH